MTFVLPTLNYHGFQHCCPSPVPKAASRTWPGVEGELKKILPFAKVLMIYTYLGLGSSRFSTKKHYWLVVWNINFMTFHILGIIIPSNFHIVSEGLKPPTRLDSISDQ